MKRPSYEGQRSADVSRAIIGVKMKKSEKTCFEINVCIWKTHLQRHKKAGPRSKSKCPLIKKKNQIRTLKLKTTSLGTHHLEGPLFVHQFYFLYKPI